MDLSVLVNNRLCLMAEEANGILECIKKECGQQIERGDPPPVLCPIEAASGNCQFLYSSVQERRELLECPAQGYKDDEGFGASSLQGKAERAGAVQHGED